MSENWLTETKDEFLSSVKKNLLAKRNCIEMFLRYLTEERKVRQENAKGFLGGMKVEDVIQSLGYYIEQNNITSKGSCTTYRACIREYFTYLTQEGKIQNDKIMSEFGVVSSDINSYDNKVNRYLEENDSIQDSTTYPPCSKKEIRAIIKKCSELIKSSQDERGRYENIGAVLVIKLGILTGVTYRKIRETLYKDVNVRYGTIKISNMQIHLPHKMIDELEEYLGIRERMINTKSEYLFVTLEGKQISDKTKDISSILMSAIGRRSFTGIIKYGIINLIKKGVNQSIICKFTGVKDTVYDDCQQQVNDEMIKASSRYLDAKIRSIETFDMLCK